MDKLRDRLLKRKKHLLDVADTLSRDIPAEVSGRLRARADELDIVLSGLETFTLEARKKEMNIGLLPPESIPVQAGDCISREPACNGGDCCRSSAGQADEDEEHESPVMLGVHGEPGGPCGGTACGATNRDPDGHSEDKALTDPYEQFMACLREVYK